MKREPTNHSLRWGTRGGGVMLLAFAIGVMLFHVPIAPAAESPADAALSTQEETLPVTMQEAMVDPPGDPSEDPEGQPPHPCILGAFDISRTCAVEIHDMAAACIESIAELFANGQGEEVPQAVEACVAAINQQAEDCLSLLHDHCDACISELIEEDAPIELIEAVAIACREGAEHILVAKRDALEAIDGAVEHGIAQTCVRAMRRIAAECAQENAAIAQTCVEEIESLLEQGLVEEALQAARACSVEIRVNTADCTQEILRHCRACMERLIHRCADEQLIRRVRKACEQSLHLAYHSAKRALGQIKQALPPPPDDGGDDLPDSMPTG